jgi:hypothetical protein
MNIHRRQLLWSAMSLNTVILAGCCSVEYPNSPPDWIVPSEPSPVTRACSAYDQEMSDNLRLLTNALEEQKQCCGQNVACSAKLVTDGSRLWNKTMQSFSLVHTNLPTADKLLAVSKNREDITNLKVCTHNLDD